MGDGRARGEGLLEARNERPLRDPVLAERRLHRGRVVGLDRLAGVGQARRAHRGPAEQCELLHRRATLPLLQTRSPGSARLRTSNGAPCWRRKDHLEGGGLVKGVQFVIDDFGRKTAVQIDLKKQRRLWEDFYDQALLKKRASEPRESLERVKQRVLGRRERRRRG